MLIDFYQKLINNNLFHNATEYKISRDLIQLFLSYTCKTKIFLSFADRHIHTYKGRLFQKLPEINLLYMMHFFPLVVVINTSARKIIEMTHQTRVFLFWLTHLCIKNKGSKLKL